MRKETDIETVLKTQLLVSTLLMTPCLYKLAHVFLPAAFFVSGVCSSPFKAFLCVGFGLWGGCLIGFVTEYYTSFSYRPVREPSEASRVRTGLLPPPFTPLASPSRIRLSRIRLSRYAAFAARRRPLVP